MGQTRKQAELILLAKVDEPTLQRSIAHFRKLEQAESDARGAMVKRVQTVRESLAASVANAKQESIVSAEAARAIDTQVKARERLINVIDRQANAQRNALLKGAAPTAPAAVSGRGGNASSALSALGSVLPGPGGDIARSLGNLSRLTTEITKFSQETGIAISSIGKATPALAGLNTGIGGLAAGGIAAVAMVALSVALDRFVKQVEEAQARLDAAIDANLEKNRLIQTATQEQIDANLEKLEADKRALEQTLKEIDATQQAAESTGDFAAAIADLTEFLGFGTAKKRAELQKELEKTNFAIDANKTARQSQSVIERTAAEAAKKAAEEQAKQAKEADKLSRASDKASAAQAELAESVDQLAILYTNIADHQRAAADTARKAEFNLAQERLRIFADYAQRIEDQERQHQRDLAREQRRADFDRLIALKQRELTEFDLLLRGDFAGVARSRREAQAQDEIDRYRAEFDANEALIAQREQDFDNQLSIQRQLAQLTQRIAQDRAAASNNELDFIRKAVQEWFKLQGIMVNVATASDAQIRKWYQWISQMATAPRINFGAPLGGGSAALAPSAPRFGQPLQSQGQAGGGFAPTGGYQPTGAPMTVNQNFYGNDPRATAQQVQTALRHLLRQ